MMRFVSTLTAAALTAAAVAGFSSGSVAAPERIKAGSLTCDVSAGIGLIVGSQKQIQCIFKPAAAGPSEVYTGMINKFGLDVGATSGGELVWLVYAPTNRRVGALAGKYAGGSAEATVGVGAGVNVLVGGSDRTITLQPVSVQGQTGLNLAAGVTGLELNRAR